MFQGMLFRVAVISLSLVLPTAATPFGAGSCTGIEGSLGGAHLAANATILAGTLDDLNATVALGPTDYLEVGKPYDFMVGERLTLVLSVDTFVEGQEEFRGFLFRLSGATEDVDTKGALTVSSDLPVLEQISNLCLDLDLSGITHLDNNLKSQVEAVLFMSEPQANLTLQVTAVVQNRLVDDGNVTEFISEYYYDEFMLNAVVPETDAPTIWVSYPPTLAPTTDGPPTVDGANSGSPSASLGLTMVLAVVSGVVSYMLA